MRSDRVLYLVLSGALINGVAFAQTSNNNASAADQKHTRVGIAAIANRSRRQGIPVWERDQLI